MLRIGERRTTSRIINIYIYILLYRSLHHAHATGTIACGQAMFECPGKEAGIQILESDEGAPRGWSPRQQPNLHLP